jgi:hypothetical protein
MSKFLAVDNAGVTSIILCKEECEKCRARFLCFTESDSFVVLIEEGNNDNYTRVGKNPSNL